MLNNKKLIKKWIKRGLGIITFLGLSLASFGGNGITNNIANAETNTQLVDAFNKDSATNSTAKTNFFDFLDIILKIIYIMVWPLLFLAGLSLDNSMVYGSFLNMDAPLWQFWNMAKNFANFALGFMLLIGILKSIFTVNGAGSFDKKDTPLGIIKRALIAGILIQASRFLTAALIDVSTIATYAIGGMPISVMKKVPQFNDKKILLTNSSLDLNSIDGTQKEPFKNSYIVNPSKALVEGEAIKPIYISQCKTAPKGEDLFIIGRVDGSTLYKNNGVVNTDPNMPTRNLCVYANKVYMFNEFPNVWDNSTDDASYKTELEANIKLFIKTAEGIDVMNNCRFIINLSDSVPVNSNGKSCGDLLKELYKDKEFKLTVDENDIRWGWISGKDTVLLPTTSDTTFATEYGNTTGELWFQNNATNTMGNIIDKAQGFVGPLVAIYASLMDFANIADTAQNEGSISKGIGELLIRTGVALGLVFPLLALAIVLIARIGFLWMVIAASPLIILNKVFELDFLKETIGIENIIRTIFAPVITVFALSISLIFMTALSDGFKPIDGKGGVVSQEQSQQQIIDGFKGVNINVIQGTAGDKTTTIEIFGQQITYPKIYGTYAGATGDRFSWMIVSLCGIGIMRFILFAAIKATGQIGSVVSNKIKGFGEQVMKTMPIIPAFGGMSISNITKGANLPETVMNNYERKQQGDFSERMEEKFAWIKEDHGTDINMSDIEANKMFGHIKSGEMQEAQDYAKKQGFGEGVRTNPDIENKMTQYFEKNNISPEDQVKFRENLDLASDRRRSKAELDQKADVKKQEEINTAQTAFEIDNPTTKTEYTEVGFTKLIKDAKTITLAKLNPDYFKNKKYKIDNKEVEVLVDKDGNITKKTTP